MTWVPCLGAWPEGRGFRFRVWAPHVRKVLLVLEGPQVEGTSPLEPEPGGYHSRWLPVPPGTRYRYLLDGAGPFPDPASRYQPEGVHGPSQTVDPAFPWRDAGWQGIDLSRLVLYELHVGTFTPEGTFRAIISRLPYLRDLGITAIELMPVAEFPGNRNWGYDGVDLFAPSRVYGTPEDLRALVDAAHQGGMAVFLDVVYNHLGPEGAYLRQFAPEYYTPRHQTPWGDAINLDGPQHEEVRRFFIENALHWIHEYHLDGLRLDATHALFDESADPFLAELARRVRETLPPGRQVLLIAEDDRNEARLIRSPSREGYGLDGVWADDFHHQVCVLLTGEQDGYFQDFQPRIQDLATILRQGWLYTGQHSVYRGHPRGTDPTGLPLARFVHCIQNHDQVGNRAFGDRLHHRVSLEAYRAATLLLLLSPATPLLFMGQEWAASSPFCYFTDHPEPLGRQVTEGRRQEFQKFRAFQDPALRAQIPDPQALETFLQSRLRWEEREAVPHRGIWVLYRDLLALRQQWLFHRDLQRSQHQVWTREPGWLFLRWDLPPRGSLLVGVCLRKAPVLALEEIPIARLKRGVGWRKILSTEDPPYGGGGYPLPEPLPETYPLDGSRPVGLVWEARREERTTPGSGAWPGGPSSYTCP